MLSDVNLPLIEEYQCIVRWHASLQEYAVCRLASTTSARFVKAATWQLKRRSSNGPLRHSRLCGICAGIIFHGANDDKLGALCGPSMNDIHHRFAPLRNHHLRQFRGELARAEVDGLILRSKKCAHTALEPALYGFRMSSLLLRLTLPSSEIASGGPAFSEPANGAHHG